MKLGQINIMNGLFFGKEELVQQQAFIQNQALGLIKVYGEKGLFNLRDKLSLTFNLGTAIVNCPNMILGIDSAEKVISFDESKRFAFNYTDTTPLIYVSIGSNITEKEVGTVTLDTNKTLTYNGDNGEFLSRIRGLLTKKYVKIKLHSNDQVYTVDSISSNNILTVLEDVSENIVESEWSILGTYSPLYSSSIVNPLYLYNSYQLYFDTTLPNEDTKFLVGTITWSNSVPVFSLKQIATSILGGGNYSLPFDYVVDSDATLRGLRSNPNATNVLIKKGVYTYNSDDGQGLVLHSNTRLIWSENNSKLIINSSSPLIGSYAFGFENNLLDNDYVFSNIKVESNTFNVIFNKVINGNNLKAYHNFNSNSNIGYKDCKDLYRCIAESAATNGVGFYSCINLFSCITGGYSKGYDSCLAMNYCQSSCSIPFTHCYSTHTKSEGNNVADTANGGFNYSSTSTPTNNNVITLSIPLEGSVDRQHNLVANCQYPVGSNIQLIVPVVVVVYPTGEGYIELVTINIPQGQSQGQGTIVKVSPYENYQIGVGATVTPGSDGIYTYVFNN